MKELRNRFRGICAGVSIAALLCLVAPEAHAGRADWMAEGSYGLMTHYLIAPPGETAEEKTAAFNATIDAFDLDVFVRQFEESGADWLIFTIGQNTGYYCAPNDFLDRALPGHTSARNLALELAKRVHGLGKRFIAYLPAEVAGQSDEIKAAFAWNPDDQSEFLKRYLAFVKAFSQMLGSNCDGWWFDGCYDPIHRGQWNWQDWCDAARTGNPASAIAFNDGSFCIGREKPVSPLQDYHAGEVHMLEDSKIRFDLMTPAKDVYKNEEGFLSCKGQRARVLHAFFPIRRRGTMACLGSRRFLVYGPRRSRPAL